MSLSLRQRKVVFTVIFAVVGFLALQVPVAQLSGSGAKLTLFDAFGPVAPAFLGVGPGVVAVALMQLANFLVHGAQVTDAGVVIRFFPMLFAAWYFGRKTPASVAVSLLAIVAFLAHPVGRSVWYFSALWLVPAVCYFLRTRWLLARSLGATFTAHAVGGALWVWNFNTTAALWNGLIPVVAVERILFALGISATYLAITAFFHWLERRGVRLDGIRLEHRWGIRSISPQS